MQPLYGDSLAEAAAEPIAGAGAVNEEEEYAEFRPEDLKPETDHNSDAGTAPGELNAQPEDEEESGPSPKDDSAATMSVSTSKSG